MAAQVGNMKVEVLRHPTDADWAWVKTCTLNTVGKKTTNVPTDEWKVKLLEAEHSPIRELWFGVRMTIPYFVSVHFVRHHIDSQSVQVSGIVHPVKVPNLHTADANSHNNL